MARWPSGGFEGGNGWLKKASCARPIRQASVSRCQGGPAGVLREASSRLKKGSSARPIRQASVSRWQGGPARVLQEASSSLGMLKKDSSSARPYAKPLCPDAKVAQRGLLYQAHTPSLCVQMARWPSEGFEGGKQQSWNAKKR